MRPARPRHATHLVLVNGRRHVGADILGNAVSPDVYYPSVVYHDVRAAYDFTDSLNAYVGIDNVADKVPPLGLTGQGPGSGNIGNSGIYEARGRFIFAGVKYNFGGSAR